MSLFQYILKMIWECIYLNDGEASHLNHDDDNGLDNPGKIQDKESQRRCRYEFKQTNNNGLDNGGTMNTGFILITITITHFYI